MNSDIYLFGFYNILDFNVLQFIAYGFWKLLFVFVVSLKS